jgi:hypothetical protein
MGKIVSSLLVSALSLSSVAFARERPTRPTSAVEFPSPSAELFKKKISDEVLQKNYTLASYSYLFTNADELPEVLSSSNKLRGFIADRVYDYCLLHSQVPGHCENGAEALRGASVTQYDDQAAASGLAGWIYDLDGDNWFDFDQVLSQTTRYLSPGRRELRVLQGFDPDGVLAQGLLQKDLPMVVDFDERTITIWTLRLED